jgi:phage baseplate assembly protein W
MGQDFVGKGWRFPILPGPTGALAYSDGDANVEHSLKVLLLTRLGERVMRGGFGSRLSDFVFRAGSEQNLHGIENEVRSAVLSAEPRVEVLEVRAEANAREPTQVSVALSYRVRRTNTRESLVFPFYLLRGDTP